MINSKTLFLSEVKTSNSYTRGKKITLLIGCNKMYKKIPEIETGDLLLFSSYSFYNFLATRKFLRTFSSQIQ